jgi:hypothetical protein
MIYKKTFWMNVILAILATLGCFMLFFVNIEYDEARTSEKILAIIMLITPILTMATFYKDSLKKESLFFNILILFILGLFTFRSLYRYPEYPIIPVLIWMVPFIINVKQLREPSSVKTA